MNLSDVDLACPLRLCTEQSAKSHVILPDAQLDAGSVADLRMTGIDLTGGRLGYRNLESGRTYAATDLRLTTGPIGYGKVLEIDNMALALTLAGDPLPGGRLDVSFSGNRVRFAPSTGRVDIPALHLQLGDARVTGSIAGGESARGAPGFDLTVDRFDPDSFLPVPTEGQYAPTKAKSAPVEPLRRLDVAGRLRFGEFRARGWELACNLRAAARRRAGRGLRAPGISISKTRLAF